MLPYSQFKQVVREKKEHEAGEDFLEYSQFRYFSFLPELSCQGNILFYDVCSNGYIITWILHHIFHVL